MRSPSALPVELSPISLPPALQTEFDGAVDLLIVETVFPTLLIPLAICLFMFTKPDIQRKPVFVLNVLSIMLGLVFGGIAVATVSRTVAGRFVGAEWITALTGLYFFIPVCVQCILFVRIFAVYPPRTTSRPLALAIYGTLFAMTVARIVNITIALKRINDAGHLAPDAWTITVVGRRIPSVMAELALGLVYDTIASSLFLFRLRQGGALRARTEHDIMSSSALSGRMSYPARLRALFWIALTNFVVPVIFNVVLLILVHNESFGNIITVIAVISVNVYVQIVSGLLATLWCHSVGPYREPSTGAAPGEKSPAMVESISTLKFASPSTLTSHIHVDAGKTNTQTSSEGEELQ
ncbi:hypothetical protein K466DRAFT_589991 [Polyporus arcularius HHB13444]|uniref:G-protein coupled receptors family 1 profile domain-containing protein n=1 Tax=Polyporus arcularius HHB13444 TaxID=1314778 RepID=A0A5C3P4B0_9APHY|nr:hypothetical protein K466DRAFT_589991 [Polyporus arcularius HHB13444]